MQSRWVRTGVAVAAIAIAVAAVLLVRQGDDGDAGNTPNDVTYAAPVFTICDEEADLVSEDPPVVGEPAPDFALCDDDGTFVKRLSDMRGSVVWLNFWATWCVPCKRELPDIQALYDEKREDGLEVLIVNYEERREKAIPFLDALGIEMPVVIDRGGRVYDRYRLTGLPDSFFIGADGNLAAIYYGFLNEEIARDRLEAAGLP